MLDHMFLNEIDILHFAERNTIKVISEKQYGNMRRECDQGRKWSISEEGFGYVLYVLVLYHASFFQ